MRVGGFSRKNTEGVIQMRWMNSGVRSAQVLCLHASPDEPCSQNTGCTSRQFCSVLSTRTGTQASLALALFPAFRRDQEHRERDGLLHLSGPWKKRALPPSQEGTEHSTGREVSLGTGCGSHSSRQGVHCCLFLCALPLYTFQVFSPLLSHFISTCN